MTVIEILGYVGAAVIIATYSMKTMIPLRTFGIVGNCIFIVYGFSAAAYPTMVLHLVLLPLNSVRLYQMLQLVKKVAAAAQGDLSMDWLKPFMSSRRCTAGEMLFRAGDTADRMFYTVSGRYRLVEIGTDVGPGQVIGELGFVAPGNRRTQSFECVEAGEVLTISYQQVRELYFQNPKFGFYFLQLTSERLFRDIRRLEAAAAEARPASIGGAPAVGGAAPGR
ncbi:MAG TPA: cyclic nucleotide-binding domain-containing protein [Burkholderiaceae bacterium]|jgi:CRP/FNR family transcriptional regulator, cyclic AMP receptor protein|nr:cyclic nucleotide-binding domain-containing protein [Burkholderiaceae bacterium]